MILHRAGLGIDLDFRDMGTVGVGQAPGLEIDRGRKAGRHAAGHGEARHAAERFGDVAERHACSLRHAFDAYRAVRDVEVVGRGLEQCAAAMARAFSATRRGAR